MSGGTQAAAPTCGGCGAPLPLDLLNPSIRCRHCGAEARVDERLRAQMRHHVGDAATAVRDEMLARWFGRFYLQNELAARGIIWGVAGGATVGVIGLIAGALGDVSGGVPLAYFVILVGLWAGSLWAFARGWGVMYAVPTPEQLASVRVARCAACGASRGFRATEAAVKCAHCGGTLLVPSELASSLLSEAKGQAALAVQNEADALARATQAGDRLTTPATIAIVGFVFLSPVAIFFHEWAGPGVPSWVLYVLFAAAFVAAVARVVQATVAMVRARRALDASIAQLSAKIAGATVERG